MGVSNDKDSNRLRKLSKPLTHLPESDQRDSVIHVDNAGEQSSQTSPKRGKRLFSSTLHRTKKKSPAPLEATIPFPVESQAHTTSPSDGYPVTPTQEETPVTAVPPVRADTTGHKPTVGFDERKYFLHKRGLKHHPYSRDEVPYMQAYNPTLLDNDRFTEILIQRLNPNGSPSFHNYGKTPPSNILDLGCGTGRWVLDTATVWRESKVTGLDIVDVIDDPKFAPNNVYWVRANFLKDPLPFHQNTFDLVRMANLSLCIPYDKWDYLLCEVRRILMPNGRLELIDDQIFFPYEKAPSSSPSTSVPSLALTVTARSEFEKDEDEATTDNDTSEDDDDFQSTKSILTSVDDDDSCSEQEPLLEKPSEARIDRAAEWRANVAKSKDLENAFEQMLVQNGIYARPQEVIEIMLEQVFGRYHSNKISTMYLALAPPTPDKDSDESSLVSTDSGNKKFKDYKWMNIEWDKKEKKEKGKKGDRSSGESMASFSQIPDSISAKAAGRLGITPNKKGERLSEDSIFSSPSVPDTISTKAAGRLGITPSKKGERLSADSIFSSSSVPDTVSAKAAGRLGINTPATPPRPSPPTQSPGLLLWPSTFIPISPLELEMHACKNLHLLLGCKSALADYLHSLKREDGVPVISDEEFTNIVWDYECFRRSRFNWPSEIPEYRLDVPLTEATPRSANNARASMGPDAMLGHPRPASTENEAMTLVKRDDLTFVRAIRVYEAVKVDEDFNPT
ncbi:hypothetical protein SERLADRAFT_412541 [Serpula lacrymans var. lacrymans S7.9]|uniref:Methyltransferase domain-containing protein n=1 Tax=Serpula lacrymans var. lacrymans (strain S7.9) TaxID=578457 RepID=F8NET0_SERL9|nr:uncharacterized protein SERLADRAFT_412541 [Serpula lacrymans var. lacrymans S7.9]EGO31078.1 hypothetical protein SERLADRAFT_412541 [Serpula lacrymans var. lacrymans S7.9]